LYLDIPRIQTVREMVSFERAGRKNTIDTLEAAFDSALKSKITRMVVASTYGDTALKAVGLMEERKIDWCRLIVVTHNYGFKGEPGVEMTEQTRKILLEKGAVVYTGTMPFRNIGTAIRETMGYSQQDLIANTLRLLGQGVKVCVEIALMAFDAGLVDNGEIITVAGTGRGADTACIIRPAPSNRLFNLKIRQIVAKPFDW